jgi:hypothetical protein
VISNSCKLLDQQDGGCLPATAAITTVVLLVLSTMAPGSSRVVRAQIESNRRRREKTDRRKGHWTEGRKKHFEKIRLEREALTATVDSEAALEPLAVDEASCTESMRVLYERIPTMDVAEFPAVIEEAALEENVDVQVPVLHGLWRRSWGRGCRVTGAALPARSGMRSAGSTLKRVPSRCLDRGALVLVVVWLLVLAGVTCQRDGLTGAGHHHLLDPDLSRRIIH